MSNNFKCIYCLRTTPDATPSKSHIIPDALGGMIILENAVCLECNSKFNKEVEMPIRDAVALVRQLLMIKTRRGKIPSIKAITRFKDLECEITVPTIGDVNISDINKDFLVFKKKGVKQIACFGVGDKVKEFQEKYEDRHKKVKWEDVTLPEKLEFESTLNFGEMCSERGMRLAAKIAFEWLCHKRGIDAVLNDDFNPLRNYILGIKNTEDIPVVSIVTNPNILSSLDNILFGIHAIIITPTTERAQVALVGLFGMVYFKVILQRYYSIITTEQPLTLINPQRNLLYEPVFKYKFMPIKAKDGDHFAKSADAIKKIFERTFKKMNSDIKAMREQQQNE